MRAEDGGQANKILLLQGERVGVERGKTSISAYAYTFACIYSNVDLPGSAADATYSLDLKGHDDEEGKRKAWVRVVVLKKQAAKRAQGVVM